MKNDKTESEIIDITSNFGTLYHPNPALVFYQTENSNSETYVEFFDMDKNGNPINAHPLTVREAQILSKTLNIQNKKEKDFLKPKGVISTNILLIDSFEKGKVIWFTQEQERDLLFVKNLNIPNGKANVPPLLWIANKQNLKIFALETDQRPAENAQLFHAPFFNVYENGNVCMGTVDVKIKNSASLEEFTESWEHYFFNSYFSHLMNNHNPIKGNCVNLWKKQIDKKEFFPKEILVKNNRIAMIHLEKPKVYFTDNDLLNPTNPVTINLIGAGGTGSQVLTALARMNHALTELNHAGLSVRLWDDDFITEANLGRQLFAESELGLYKSVALINRINRFFGTNLKAETRKFERNILGRVQNNMQSAIYISCVDNVKSRFEITEILNELKESRRLYRNQCKYWMDFGNSQYSGQVLFSTIGNIKQPNSDKYETVAYLPSVTEEFGELLKISELEDDMRSCSLAEALEKQDLYINSTSSQMGSYLLWSLFRSGMTENKGFFLNIKNFHSQPIKL